MNAWYDDRLNLSSLAAWMLDNGRADEVADMIEKPWKYGDEWTEAQS